MRVAIIVISVFFFQFTSAQEVIIKGTLNGNLKGYNRIYLYTRISNDSAEIVNGKYTFRFPFTEMGFKYFYPQYIKEQGMMYQPFGILISGPGTYEVVSDISQPLKNSLLKGPAPMVEYHQFEVDLDSVRILMNKINQNIYGNEWYRINESSPLYTAYSKTNDSLNQTVLIPLMKRQVKRYPNSVASAYLLEHFAKGVGTINDKEMLYEMLGKNAKETTPAKNFSEYIEGIKSSGIGKQVNDFTLETPEGKSIGFNSFKGKYVLLDFWASWCWPCRNSFPTMRKIREQYKDKPFEIYSISIDEDKDAWKKAVKEENNPWPQSWDGEKIANRFFAVTSIPATFLISPDGKIVEKEVGFDAEGNTPIQRYLKKVFGN